MKKLLCFVTSVAVSLSLSSVSQLKANTIHNATAISVASTGSGDDSAVIQAAVNKAMQGDTIILTSPSYKLKSPIVLSKSGTSSNLITIKSSTTQKVTLDFSGEPDGDSDYGINIKGSYWELDYLNVYSAGDNGIIMKGAAAGNNVINHCDTDNNDDAGLQITGGAHDNLVEYCNSYNNYDVATNGSNADGFACKLGAGAGNEFLNCDSYGNADDGWDLLGTDETVKIIGCTATKNGFYHGDPQSSLNNSGMNGDGIKLGGNQKPPKGTHRSLGSHIVTGCKSYDNKGAGFSQNNSAGALKLTDCDADRNGADNQLNANQKTTKGNFNFPYNPNNGNVFTFTDCTTTGKYTIYGGAKVIGGNISANAPNTPLPGIND